VTVFVLDASVTATWCFADEASPATDLLLTGLLNGGAAIVPGLWRWEVANLFVTGLRRTRLTGADVAVRQAVLESLPIVVEPAPEAGQWRTIVDLAQASALTAYDASYLDLALREELPLATLDTALARAARGAGVTLLL
jgi:predicted nucleic acid-binding protein